MVGLIPLFAVETLEPELLDRLPDFKRLLEWFIDNRRDLVRNVACMRARGNAVDLRSVGLIGALPVNPQTAMAFEIECHGELDHEIGNALARYRLGGYWKARPSACCRKRSHVNGSARWATGPVWLRPEASMTLPRLGTGPGG